MNLYQSFSKKELKDHCDSWDCYAELVECLNNANYEFKENSENNKIDSYLFDDGKIYKNGIKITKQVLINDAYSISLALRYAKYYSNSEIRAFFNLD